MAEVNAPVIRSRLIATAERDPRIVGVVDYGSGSEARADEWSDVDVALFVRDADFEDFERGWKGWAAQFGPLLLAYVGGVGRRAGHQMRKAGAIKFLYPGSGRGGTPARLPRRCSTRLRSLRGDGTS